MKKWGLAVCLCAALISMPAFAARQCYSTAELEAEQLLRLHSELMVISYACKQGSKGQDLVTIYNGFTRNNIVVLHDAEATLIDYYKTAYHDDGISHLDELRTRLGNEAGQNLADNSAPQFCRYNRDQVVLWFYASREQLKKAAQNMMVTQKSIGSLCKVASVVGLRANMDKARR